jgi:hypothetical protein
MDDNLSWELDVKWEVFAEENKINLYELPEKIQQEIELFEDAFSDYEELEDHNEKDIRNLELILTKMDNGILNNLQTFVATQKLKIQTYLN